MGRLILPLTDTKIKNAKALAKDYKLFDGDGLFLLVKKNGSKLWRMKFFFEGKEKLASLGQYPTVSLREARDLKEDFRRQLRADTNPIEEKKKERDKEKREQDSLENTFEKVALQALKVRKTKNSDDYFKRSLQSLTKDAFPAIGDKPISQVEVADIKNIYLSMRKRKIYEPIRKLRTTLSYIFEWAINENLAERNPVNDINLQLLIGKQQTVNYPASTSEDDIKNLIYKIKNYGGEISTTKGLLFLILTTVRSINVREAEWSEIDLKDKLWRIPKEKMKTKEDLIVPLTPSSIKILNEMKKYKTSNYIFAGGTSIGTLSDGTFRTALRNMQIAKEEYAVHGFRSMFSTIAHEKSGFSHEAIEKQIAHSIGNSVSQAYNRAIYLDERRKLMQWWDDYLNNIEPML